MVAPTVLTTSALLSGVLAVLAGCSGKATPPAKSPRNAPARAAAARPTRPAKSSPRESPLSVYNNPEFGVTFRYPRNYSLQEGAPQDLPGVRSQQQLSQEQPGANLAATLVIPDDAYPNTTFAGGTVQFAVNRYLTDKACHQDLLSRLGDSNGSSGALAVQGVPFAWTESEAGSGSTEFLERNYAGFANGACYEFFVRIGTNATEDEEGVRQPDEKRILGHLEKIIASLQVEPRAVSILDKPAPKPAAPIFGDHGNQ
jgi:hypothetical protein